MIDHPWSQQTILLCVESYENGVPRGHMYLGQEGQCFDSLTQLLLRAEQLLERSGEVQYFTIPRSFSIARPLGDEPCIAGELTRGKVATFEMRVLFRQHTSWQGAVTWVEGAREETFRSALELLLLMDSAICVKTKKE